MLSKKDQIYQEILSRLFSGRYRFGDPIQVKEISEETGVSRHPIMTALYSLQECGLIRITAQVGCEVISPTIEEVSDFYRMFSLIEGLIGEFAAIRRTDADLLKLRMINEQIASIAPDTPDAGVIYRELNVAFHKQLHAMSYAPLVCSRQASNFELSDFYLVQTGGITAHLPLVAQEHQQIIDALAKRDAQAAGQWARAHLESVAQDVLAAMEKRAVA